MAEESHLDEMREAIRGDFERLAERRGDQELLRVDEPEDPEVGARQEAESEPGVSEPDDDGEVDADTEPEPRSWLARLLSP
jgi:hypothetical protein